MTVAEYLQSLGFDAELVNTQNRDLAVWDVVRVKLSKTGPTYARFPVGLSGDEAIAAVDAWRVGREP